jgi:hypothetical protein
MGGDKGWYANTKQTSLTLEITPVPYLNLALPGRLPLAPALSA